MTSTATAPGAFNITILKPSRAAIAIAAMIKSGEPVCVWGTPGVGKSMMMDQVVQSINMNLISVYASLLESVDLRGVPNVLDGQTRWNPPVFLPRDGAGVLFWDDFTRAPTSVMNGVFSLLLPPYTLGEYALPKGWVSVAASNHEKDGGGVNRMPAALANRFTHIEIEPDSNDWTKWAAGAAIEPLVIAFIGFKPQLLNVFDPKAKAFPTPRAWAKVSKIVGQHAPLDIELALVEGTVGHAAAIEFEAFAQMWRNLPSIDAILMNPTSAAIPTEIGTLYAVSSALAYRANESNWSRVIQYLDRLPTEFAVFSVNQATSRTPTLQKTPDFIMWASLHNDLI